MNRMRKLLLLGGVATALCVGAGSALAQNDGGGPGGGPPGGGGPGGGGFGGGGPAGAVVSRRSRRAILTPRRCSK